MKNILIASLVTLSVSTGFASDKSATSQVVEIQITENGFEPSNFKVKPDSPVTLKVTRKTDNTCATEIL